MNEATLDRWMTMRMLTPEVGELDVDGFRISVVERPVAKFDENDPDFAWDIRITKLNVPDTSHAEHMAHLKAYSDMIRAENPLGEPKKSAPKPDPPPIPKPGNAMQAKYMTAIRGLPRNAMTVAKRIRKFRGPEAAIAYAQSVVRPKRKAK